MKLYFDRCRSRIGQRSGYTAIELLVVIALVAIMTAMALPHFTSMVDRWRVDQAVTQLQHVLRFASVQAIRTGSYVVIQASCRSLQKNAQNWSCGLTVFQDINHSNSQDADEPILQEVPKFHALTVMHSPNSAYLTYNPYGVPVGSFSRFEVSPAMNPDPSATQTICLSAGGRIRVQAGSGCSS